MKKIGILTFHNTTNIGANLQAYALMKFLKKKELNVEIIDYINPIISEHSIQFKKQALCNLALKRGVLQYFKTLFNFKYNAWNNIINNYNNFRKKYFSLSNQCNNYLDINYLNYDTIVVGSDQIWNPNILVDFDPIYFGEKLSANNIISYAASIGIDSFDEKHEYKFVKLITNLKNISVREKTAQKYISSLIKKNVYNVCDPTFLLEKQDYENLIKDSSLNIEGEFIFYYALKDEEYIINKVCEFKEKLNLPVFKMYNNRLYKNNKFVKYIEPSDFLYLISYSKLIITNAFHGLALSIIMEKEFYVSLNAIPTKSRIVDLLKLLNLEKRILDDNFSEEKIDFIKVKENLAPFIEYSKKYLEENI